MADGVKIHGVELEEQNDIVVFSHKKHGKFEPESMRFWSEHIGHGLAIDVGAYTGIYSLVAAKLNSNVLAIEPNEHAFQRMLRNVSRNGSTISLLNAAAGSQPGNKELFIKSKLSSANSFVKKYGRSVMVDVVTLDNIARNREVSCIKVDAEGYEVEVLKGAVNILQYQKPHLITEALSEQAIEDQEHFLSQFGYNSPRVADKRNLIWVP